jgi:hypothetical protein
MNAAIAANSSSIPHRVGRELAEQNNIPRQVMFSGMAA